MTEKIEYLGIGNLKICQDSDYFCFGTDSVLLANFASSNSKNKVVLDLCSGSGVVPIIFSAKNSYKKIFTVELQDEMYYLLDKNIDINNLKSDIIPIKSDIKDIPKIKKSLIEHSGRSLVDIITVNPPYKKKGTGIPNELRVKYIAKHEEMCNLEDVFKVSSALLENRGSLYIVHKPERLTDLICIARKYNLEAKKLRLVIPRIGKRPSLVLLEYVKGGGNEMRILPPLIEYDNNMQYTEEMNKIYDIKEKLDE